MKSAENNCCSEMNAIIDRSEVYKLHMVRMALCLTNLRMKEMAEIAGLRFILLRMSKVALMKVLIIL